VKLAGITARLAYTAVIALLVQESANSAERLPQTCACRKSDPEMMMQTAQ
jgi:hypothetical protein